MYLTKIVAFQYGFGAHLWNVTLEQMLSYTKMLVGIMTIYVWTPALTKLSLLALYHRLDPDRTSRGCIYALALLVFGYSLAITIVAAGPCNPQTHTDQKCLTDLNLFMAIINILTDFFILCLPIPMLRRLQLPTKQKILLGLVFALGSGYDFPSTPLMHCLLIVVNRVVVISTVRIIYVYNLISDPDATYNQAAACIFSSVELNGGVMCACIALLKPFFQQYMPWVLSLSSRSRSRSRSGILGIFGKRSNGSSYELRSAEGDAIKRKEDRRLGGQIAVTTTYSVQEKTGRADSTEDLFTLGSKSWDGVK